jgi:mRNA interferase RelE/StbE
MAWTIEISEDARKDLKRLGHAEAIRIVRFLDERVATRENPRTLAEPLAGDEYAGLWRFRVGPFRIISRIDDGILTVLVLEIGHRGRIYKT